ncbi:response regulator transcription factor [Actinomadura formosensis]|uniref:response regulator transcription factor n=1 Tax=Actinomadura formosensis TaxID=60706 RepID=UPI001040E590|nr:response regulator transcription factor [Actinomadura formosensis]
MVEPRELIRSGLAAILERLGGIQDLECHCDLDELLVSPKVRGGEWQPDICIVGSDAAVARHLRSRFPSCRLLGLVASAEPEDLERAARTNADGYLMLHDTTATTLVGTLHAVMSGELPMPLQVGNYLLERVRTTEAPPPRVQPYFSPREHDVIALLLEGLSNRQISVRLGISLHSAKRHVSAILHKVNSPSRAHFVAQMLRDG